MRRRSRTFIFGFHGCDAAVARQVLSGDIEMAKSEKDYDWLGPGVYFWENDPQRALEWAQERQRNGKIEIPAVIGAVIDLGRCFDLTLRENLELLRIAHAELERDFGVIDAPLPENREPKGASGDDKLLRYLDCAVIRRAHTLLEEIEFPPADTVRGLFQEGEPIYPGAKFMERSHTQIAVLNPECIVEVFNPKALRDLPV